MTSSGHPIERLADLAVGTVPPADATAVRAHVDGCPSCAAELDGWTATRDALRVRAAEAVPAPDLGARVLAAVAAAAEPARPAAEPAMRRPIGRRLRWLVRFVLGQAPLVRREIWPASAVVVGIGAAISLLPPADTAPGAALSLFAPLAAAIGIALIYGQESDPSLELALATPTSPRLVVLARLVLVLAFDTALALAASAALVAVHGPGIAAGLVGQWLGPMLLLGCLSLALSLVVGATSAIAVGFIVWSVRTAELAKMTPARVLDGLPTTLDLVWQTSPLTLGLAAVCLAVALALAPRFERVALPWNGVA